MTEPQFRELTGSAEDLAFLERLYGEIYVPEFPNPDERESLENMQRYLRLKAEGWYGPNGYHIVVMLSDGAPVGLSISDYLSLPKAGVIEFLVIAQPARGSGCGSRLLACTEALFAGDAARNGEKLSCIAAEMNDPFRSPLDDSLDPFRRACVWSGWGFGRLDFPYVQPALDAGKGAVANLLLMAKPALPELAQAFPAKLVDGILRNYMIWAMRIAEPETAPVYRAMRRHLDAHPSIALRSLGAYVGRDPAKPLDIHEVAGRNDPDAAPVLSVYRRAFPGGPTNVDPDVFLRCAGTAGYHLWALRREAAAVVEGMASFFGLQVAGFGGYVALTGSLRRTGRFALLLARMEEAMRRDGPSARGLCIECDPAKESFFRAFGFRTVDLTYRQPPLPGDRAYDPDEAPPLLLMYKDFGRNYETPLMSVADFLAAMRAILSAVYGISANSPFVDDLERQASRWPGATVAFRP